MLQILDLCRWEDLYSYHSAWDALCDRAGERNPWASLQWLKTVCESNRDDLHPRALFAFDDHQLVGVVPLLGAQHGHVWSWRTPNPSGCSGAPAGSQPTATLCAALDYLARCDTSWSSVTWSHVAGGSGLLARLRSSALHAELPLTERVVRHLAVVDLENGSEAYWNGLPSARRSNLARQFAVLSAQQRLRFESATGFQAAALMPESAPLAQGLLGDAAANRTPRAAALYLDGRMLASAWGVRLGAREHLGGFLSSADASEDLLAIFWRQWISHSLDTGVRSVQGDAAWPGLADFATRRSAEIAVQVRGPAAAHDGWWQRLRAWVGEVRPVAYAAGVGRGGDRLAAAAASLPQGTAARTAVRPHLQVVADDDLLDALPAPAAPREHVGRPQIALWNQASAEQPVEG